MELQPLREGLSLAAGWRKVREIIDYLRSQRLIAGSGIRIDQRANGITISATHTPAGTGTGAPAAASTDSPFPARIVSGSSLAGYVVTKYENGLDNAPTGFARLYALECAFRSDLPGGTIVMAHPAALSTRPVTEEDI